MGCSDQTTIPDPTVSSPVKDDTVAETSKEATTPNASTLLSPISPITTQSAMTSTATPNLRPAPTITVPAPKNNLAVVYGQIRRVDGQPYVKTLVRLGEITWVPGQEGIDGFASSDRVNSPQDTTDEWGNFIIEDVPPGSYGLAVDNPELPNSTVYILNDTGDRLLVIETGPKQIVDLGVVKFNFN